MQLIPPIGAIQVVLENLDEVLVELNQKDQVISSGVASIGEAAAYALVWEWGSARISEPGPNTCIGVNPDGSSVILSVQAPFGYISINEPLYWAILEAELKKIKFGNSSIEGLLDELQQAALRAAEEFVPILRSAAPKDSGALRDSIQVVDPGELSDSEDESTISEGKWRP